MKGKRNIKNQLTKINITKMTKVSVFGQQPTETKELKKIEFVKCIYEDGLLSQMYRKPTEFNEVMLLEKKYGGGYDAILAIDDESGISIVLGHWNDGIV